jgi:excinuclease ABC subunit B
MPSFEIVSDFGLTGDQPQAVDKLVEGIDNNYRYQTLLGVTGSGKTFAMANVIARVQKPTLIISHNKTLAAQLYSEFKEFFPKNAAEYFVSYYDYYQPEAYLPQRDMYIEKDADINDEIDKLRHAATHALLSRKDVVIVASVSCIYGLGEPEEYRNFILTLKKGQQYPRQELLRQLVNMQYERNDVAFTRSRFRLRGDTLEIQPAYEELAIRIGFFGDEVERISSIDPLTGELLNELAQIDIYPAKHFVTSPDKLEKAINSIGEELEERLAQFNREGKLLEAARLQSRTNYDLEMLKEGGYCKGVENYSRHLSQRPPGSPPWTLIDYFPKDYLLIIDESHMTLPQIRGMYTGDMSRKQTLIDYGFRLPSALDNRPLNFTEFNQRLHRVIYTSATPSEYEYQRSKQVVEQLVRPALPGDYPNQEAIRKAGRLLGRDGYKDTLPAFGD